MLMKATVRDRAERDAPRPAFGIRASILILISPCPPDRRAEGRRAFLAAANWHKSEGHDRRRERKKKPPCDKTRRRQQGDGTGCWCPEAPLEPFTSVEAIDLAV